MMSPLLLDTCAAIWIAEGIALAREATQALDEAYDASVPAYVSPITAWEIGLLVARGRLTLLIKPELWFARLMEVLNLRQADMSADVLIASSFLPGSPPRDPADL